MGNKESLRQILGKEKLTVSLFGWDRFWESLPACVLLNYSSILVIFPDEGCECHDLDSVREQIYVPQGRSKCVKMLQIQWCFNYLSFFFVNAFYGDSESEVVPENNFNWLASRWG